MPTEPSTDCYEGVILVSGFRPGVGYCGWLRMKRVIDGAEIAFFDGHCHKNPGESFRTGDVVHFHIERRKYYRRLEPFNFEAVPLFIEKLRAEKDRLSRLIYARLSADTQDLIATAKASKQATLEALAFDLNDLVRKVRLSKPELIPPNVMLSDATQLLMDLDPRSGESLMRLNCLILRDAYPEHITTAQDNTRFWPTQLMRVGKREEQIAAARVTATMGVFNAEGRSGSVLLPNDAVAQFRFDYFPDESFIPETLTPVCCEVMATQSGLQAFDLWPLQGLVHEDPDIAHELPPSVKYSSPSATDQPFRDQIHERGVDPGPSTIGRQRLNRRGNAKPDISGGKGIFSNWPEEGRTTTPVHDSGIKYDIGTHSLVFKNGTRTEVPSTWRWVLEYMLQRSEADRSTRKSRASYEEVAFYFECGKVQQLRPNLSDDEVRNRMRHRSKEAGADARRRAQQFARGFRVWLEKNGVSPKALIRCDRRNKCYVLSSGWNLSRMVVGDSEVSQVKLGNGLEYFSGPGDPERPEQSASSEDFHYDPQGYDV